MRLLVVALLGILLFSAVPISAAPGNITSTTTKAVTSTEILVSSPTPQNFSFNPATTPHYFGQDLGQFITTTAPNGFKFSTAPTDSMTMTLPKVGPSVLSSSLVFFNSTQTAWELVPSVGNTVNVYFKPAGYSVKISIVANLLSPQTVCLPFSSPSLIFRVVAYNETSKTTFLASEIRAGNSVFDWSDISALYAPSWNQVQSSLCLSLPVGLTNIDPIALDGHAENSGGGAALLTVTLSTSSSPDIIIVNALSDNSVTESITDTSSLTWNHRATSNDGNLYAQEWYAVANSSLSSDIITVHDGGVGNIYSALAYGVSGATTAGSTSTRFDSNGAIPCTATAGTGTTASCTISTTNANDFLAEYVRVNNINGNAVTLHQSFSSIGTTANGDIDGYSVVSSTQSGVAITATWTGNQRWMSIVDAIKASAVVTVTQPIKITTANGAPAATISISGCSVSNATFTANGNVKTYSSVTASCTITLTEPADGSNTRYRWNVSPHATAATVITFGTCAGPGTCSEYDNTTYYQLQQYHHVIFAVYGGYEVYPLTPNAWDGNYSTTLMGTYLGASNQNVCLSGKAHTLEGATSTSAPSGGASGVICTNDWADYNTAVTIGGLGGTTTIGNTWSPSPAGSNVFTETTGANSLQTSYVQSTGGGSANQNSADYLWLLALPFILFVFIAVKKGR